MSNTKRYPTRMHEVLGVESKEMFALNGDPDNPNYYLTDDGDMFLRYGTANKIIRMAHADEVFDAINQGITRRPRLTEEQVKELKALLVFDKKWLVKETELLGIVWAFSEKPTREEDGGWWSYEIENDFVMTLPLGAAVNSLVSSSDPAPLDIVATLKSAGMEVE